jgi:hypothetical protein
MSLVTLGVYLSLLWASTTQAYDGHHAYDGHKVFRVVPQTEKQLELIRNLLEGNPHVDVWQEPTSVGQSVDVQIPPEHAHAAREDFKSQGIEHRIIIDDLKRKIIDHLLLNELHSKEDKDDGNMFQRYHPFSKIMDWMESKATRECGNRCQLFDIGRSFENRTLKGIKIGTPGNNKEAIWIDGGIHAREWIAPSTVLYFIERLIDDYGPEDSAVTVMVDTYDWYILPVLNADGYEYSWQKDRLWRKTRSTHQGTSCVGVDPNRNFDYKWNTVAHADSSDPCSNTFAGFSAMSEPETRNQAEFMLKRSWKLFLTMHSYSQLMMCPWGYTSDEPPPNYKDMMSAAAAAVDALYQVNHVRYGYGPASIVICKYILK